MKGRWIITLCLVLTAAGWTGAQAQDAPPDAPPPAAPAEEPLGDEEAMVLNFERADIREVIHSLATALGISYTIDPRIEGQVTIRTTGRISRQDLFPLLNQILRNNGISAVKVGDLYQILPVAEAKTRAIIPRTAASRRLAGEDDSFVIEILSVEHVSADEMVNILQPFVTPGGDVLAYPRGNLIVVTDLQSNVDRLRELVATFDSNVFRDLRTRVFKVVHGDPEELANEILGLLAPYGVTGGEAEAAGLYLIPLLRLSSIVVVAFDPAIFAEVERWLKLLDIPPEEGAGRQTFVYNVENAKAADLAAVLNELFGGGPGGGGGGVGGRAAGAPPGGVGLFGAGGVSGTGGGAAGGVGGRIGGGRGRSAAGGAQTGAAFSQQAGAAGGVGAAGGGGVAGGARLGGARRGATGGAGTAAAAGTAAGGGAVGVSLPGGRAAAGGVGGAAGGTGGPPPIFKEEVRIVADDVTNSLVILATKRDYQLILEVLRKIDVVPRQVLLEVTIAEITLTKDLSLGIAYAVADKKLGLALPGNDPNASIFQVQGPPGGRSGAEQLGGLLGTAARVPAQGAFAVLSNRDNFNVFLNALQGITTVKMLSAPHIVAADNREAHILVGQSIPILTASQTSTLANANIVNSVQYRDTGKILTVLPQVNSRGLVNMQIRQEVSAVGSPNFGATQSPSFITREAETTVVVHDGETVVIGGIIDDSLSTARTGVPFLMDIPFVGRAFRRDDDRRDRIELLILITPYVVRTREESRSVTDEFSDRLQGLKHLNTMLRTKRDRLTRRKAESGVPPVEVVPDVPPRRPPDLVPPEAAP